MTLISIKKADGSVERVMIYPDDRKVDEILKSHHEILENYLNRARDFLPTDLGDDFASAMFDLGYFIDEHVPEGIDPLP